ncbi:hypothetical protein BC940DRAFT_304133 [Gongronella butleri]|nr:hypothetical protein BC940DRAFT_304133 [Gongronella butleri]
MTRSLLTLPPEILDLVVVKLDNQEIRECCVVSAAWHRRFLPFLYKRLVIRHPVQLQQVCDSFLAHAEDQVADAVRSLDIHIKTITSRHLPLLTAWCKNVDSLTLRWSIWHEHDHKVQMEQQQQQQQHASHASTSLLAFPVFPAAQLPPSAAALMSAVMPATYPEPPPVPAPAADDGATETTTPTPAPTAKTDPNKTNYEAVMASFIAPFKHLLQLTTMVSFGMPDATVPSFLPFLPRLTKLDMKNGCHLTLEYVEHIHERCPSLQTLVLQCTLLQTLFELQDVNLAGNDTAIASPWTPTDTLRTLQLEFINGFDGYLHDWLLYFALKYPRLVNLHLRQYGSTFTTDLLDAQQRPVAGTRGVAPTRIFQLLSQRCPELRRVEFRNINVHPAFWRSLTMPLEHVSLYMPVSPPRQTIDAPGVPTAIGVPLMAHTLDSPTLAKHLTTLELAPCLPADIQAHAAVVQPLHLCDLLARFTHLKHLTLQWKKEAPPMELDALLTSVPRLVTLALAFSKITISPLSSGNLRRHRLHALTLKSAVFTDDVFPWMNAHCPQLKHLALYTSCRTIPDLALASHHLCRILLPDTRLDTLAIEERSVMPIRLFSLFKMPCDKVPKERLHHPHFSHLHHPQHCAWHMVKSYDHVNSHEYDLVALNANQSFESTLPTDRVRLSCPWYEDFCNAAEAVYKRNETEKDDVHLITTLPYMHILCLNVANLVINGKKIPFVA